MNQGKVFFLFLALFIALTLAPVPKLAAQAAGPQITTAQLLYPIWHVGGKVNFTASRLTINNTYYVWYQRPNDPYTRYAGTSLFAKTTTAPFQVTVTATDSAGTYLVSLSTGLAADTHVAVAHFGVFGTDRSSYKRTDVVHIAGGGFAPNSTILAALTTRGVSAGNLTLQIDTKGNFNTTYTLFPSILTGQLVLSLTGSTFDSRTSATATTSMSVTAAPLTISMQTQPEPIVERTSNATSSLKITYPDGSPVTTSASNSTRVEVVSDTGGIATEVQLVASNPSGGIWTVSWMPSFSANLGSFHFIFSPSDFDDKFGNLGQGPTITSNSFQITPAHTALVIQGNATIQRTLPADIVIIPTYHDGKPFANVTQASGNVTEVGGAPHQLLFNRTLDEFVGHFKTTPNSTLGTLTASATVTDLFGNTATGTITLQIVPAVLGFAVNAPPSQRTTLLNVTARVTYPDGSIITPANLPSGFNVTLSLGNFTWTSPMGLNETNTNAWSASYRLAQNATLGNYAVAMNATDPFGNAGHYTGKARVDPATFKIQLPRSVLKASPHTLVYIVADVIYPNGSALTPTVGGVVTASLTNSSGVFTLPMVFNATDRSWLLVFTAPDPGLRFGITLTFSFSADDQFGNAGSASKAFELDVGAGTQTLILATIIGALPPIILISWAIATVSTRRRKHKP